MNAEPISDADLEHVNEVAPPGYPDDVVPIRSHYLSGMIARLRRAEAEIAELKAERAWRPIETAPRDGTPLLLFCPGINSWNRPRGAPDIVVGVWANEDYSFGWYSDIGDVDQGYESTGAYFVHERLRPTHWQPLPALPTEETDNG